MTDIAEGLCRLPWSVLTVAPRRETEVFDTLMGAGWQCYLPIERRLVGSGPRRHEARRPVFERYLFAALLPGGDDAAPAECRHVVSTHYRFDGGSVVRPRVMLTLLAADAAGAFDHVTPKSKSGKCLFKAGDLVRLIGSPFAGWEGSILEVLSRSDVRVEIDLFGRLCPTVVDVADCEAVA